LKSQLKVFKDSAEVEAQYNALLSFIRDLEFSSDQEGVKEKIAMLDDILDLLGVIMLTAPKDIESE
jgi:hypothetical protein|tara:strand:- start:1098 stop:1295 length:198 start_codon:yes stop_codon:yes gene_type:complete